MSAILAWIFQQLGILLYGITKEELIAILNEYQAKKADQKKADDAVSDVRKTLDPTKTIEEKRKEQEDAFDHFHDRLN